MYMMHAHIRVNAVFTSFAGSKKQLQITNEKLAYFGEPKINEKLILSSSVINRQVRLIDRAFGIRNY